MKLSVVGTTLVLGLLGTTVCGCSLASRAADAADDSEEDSVEEAPASGDSYAGKWTREDNGAVFEVSDDGTTVSGKLVDGKADYLEYFESYGFELKRKGSKLVGKAAIVFKDTPDETLETKWEVTRDGDTLKGKLEYVTYDDDGAESGRGTEDKSFSFAAAAAAAAPAYTPPAVDMSAYVPVLPNYKYVLYDDMAVGHWIEEEMETAGQKHKTKMAVVAETDDAWVIEIDNQMNQKDLLIAVFVDKESGRCLKAFVGNRGKEGKEKDVPPEPEPMDGGEPVEAEEEDVEVEAGSFAAKKMQNGGTTSWMGTEGDAENVLLKAEGDNYSEELLELDAGQTYDAGGTEFEAKYLRYKKMGEQWHASGDKPYFKAMLKMKTTAMTKALVGQGDDAEPQFDYPR